MAEDDTGTSGQRSGRPPMSVAAAKLARYQNNMQRQLQQLVKGAGLAPGAAGHALALSAPGSRRDLMRQLSGTTADAPTAAALLAVRAHLAGWRDAASAA